MTPIAGKQKEPGRALNPMMTQSKLIEETRAHRADMCSPDFATDADIILPNTIIKTDLEQNCVPTPWKLPPGHC